MSNRECVDLYHQVIDILEHNRPDLEPKLAGGGAAPLAISVKSRFGVGRKETDRFCWWFSDCDEDGSWGAQLINEAEGADDPDELIDLVKVNPTEAGEIASVICIGADPGFLDAAIRAMMETADTAAMSYRQNPKLDTHKILDAAWEPVTKAFPNILTGDLAIDLELDLHMRVEELVRKECEVEKVTTLLKKAIFWWLAVNFMTEQQANEHKERIYTFAQAAQRRR